MRGVFAPLLTLALSAGAAFAQSTIDATARFAYAADAGWVNLRPSAADGVVFGEYQLSGWAYGANVGWIDLGDGSPANGIQYQNNAAGDFGVNHDGFGNLSGYAYGANIGWVHFGWAAASDPQRARVDLLTGAFTGFAYAANVGWLNLGSGFLATGSMRCTDTDADGMADEWERGNFGNLTAADAATDADGDGALDRLEYIAGTDANDQADYFRLVSVTYNGTYTQAQVVFTTDPIRLYRLETSAALAVAPDTWVDSGLGTFAPDAGLTTTRTISWPGGARRFIRAVAVKPLQP